MGLHGIDPLCAFFFCISLQFCFPQVSSVSLVDVSLPVLAVGTEKVSMEDKHVQLLVLRRLSFTGFAPFLFCGREVLSRVKGLGDPCCLWGSRPCALKVGVLEEGKREVGQNTVTSRAPLKTLSRVLHNVSILFVAGSFFWRHHLCPTQPGRGGWEFHKQQRRPKWDATQGSEGSKRSLAAPRERSFRRTAVHRCSIPP